MRKVGPQSIEPRRQKELLFAEVFLEREQHTIDDIDFDGVENDIPEITHGSGIHVLENIEPAWTDA